MNEHIMYMYRANGSGHIIRRWGIVKSERYTIRIKISSLIHLLVFPFCNQPYITLNRNDMTIVIKVNSLHVQAHVLVRRSRISCFRFTLKRITDFQTRITEWEESHPSTNCFSFIISNISFVLKLPRILRVIKKY